MNSTFGFRIGVHLTWVAFASGACSSRLDAVARGVDTPSCSTLLAAEQGGVEPEGSERWVWLMSQPHRSLPLVINWQSRRIAGKAARLVDHAGRTWLVNEEYALSTDWVEAGRIEGLWAKCDELGKAEPYAAVPLAPAVGQARGLTEVTRFSGDAAPWPAQRTSDLALQRAGLVVVARGADGLRWLELSSRRSAISEVGHLPVLLGDDYNDVAVISERYLAVASRSRGLLVVDAANPAAPQIIADALPLLQPRDGHSVFVSGSRLYLAQAPTVSTGAVVAFDVSDPEVPRQLWRWQAEQGDDAHDVTVRGDHLYVSSIRGGITLLDARADDMPRVVARRRGLGAHSCSLVDGATERVLWGEERLGGTLHRIDVDRSDGAVRLTDTRLQMFEPARSAARAAATFAASPHNSACHDTFCFVAHYQLGLQVLDVGSFEEAGRAALGVAVVAQYPTWRPSALGESMWLRGATGVALDLPWVYVADTDAGLVVLRYDAATASPRRQAE
jgi:hypothetical protein